MKTLTKISVRNRLEVKAWLVSNYFAQVGKDIWETGWSHTDGHGWITFRVMQHDHGYWIIVETMAEHAVNLGTATTLGEIKRVFETLKSL